MEKLYIMQFLISELVQEENELFQPDVAYPIWSPYDAFEAAAMMLKVQNGAIFANEPYESTY